MRPPSSAATRPPALALPLRPPAVEASGIAEAVDASIVSQPLVLGDQLELVPVCMGYISMYGMYGQTYHIRYYFRMAMCLVFLGYPLFLVLWNHLSSYEYERANDQVSETGLFHDL